MQALRLAAKLSTRELGPKTLVLAVSDGARPLAAAIAKALRVPSDVLLVDEVRGDAGLAIGAVAGDGARFLDAAAIDRLGLDFAEVRTRCERAGRAAALRERALRGGRGQRTRFGRCIILVDTALATPARCHAAIRALSAYQVERIIVAAPSAAPAAAEELAYAAEEVVTLAPDDARAPLARPAAAHRAFAPGPA